MSREKAPYLDGAEPLFIKGSGAGCLLLHGAGGGSSWDLKEFAHVMHDATGMTIWLPALKGFGTRPEDLLEITFEDWMQDARDGVERLKGECDSVYIVGHSVGGDITLILGSEYPDLRAVVTWSAPYKYRNRLLPLLPVISKLPLLKRVVPEKVDIDVSRELEDQGWVGYDWIPPSVGFAVLDGLRELKRALPGVTCPALIVQGTMDEVVEPVSAKRIFNRIGSEVKEIRYVEGAGHALMNHPDYRDGVFSETIDFIRKH